MRLLLVLPNFLTLTILDANTILSSMGRTGRESRKRRPRGYSTAGEPHLRFLPNQQLDDAVREFDVRGPEDTD
jgi:hypothetical protein